jgi:hypothetical protein
MEFMHRPQSNWRRVRESVRRWLGLALAVVAVTLSPREVGAESVVLARPPASDPPLYEAFGRLRAELELQGFSVVVLSASARPRTTTELEQLTAQHHAFAAIALQRLEGDGTAEVQIVDRMTGKSTTRQLLIEASPNGPTLLVVRATDLLRASLMEFAPGERPPKEVLGVEPGPPPPSVLRFTQKPLRFEVHAGASVLGSGVLGAAVGPSLGAQFYPTIHWSLGVELCGPLFGARYETPSAEGVARQELALLRLGWSLPSVGSGRGFQWGPAVSAGAYHLSATSRVSAPLVPRSASFWSAVAGVGLRGQYVFGNRFSLGAHAGVLAHLPRPVIAIDREQLSPIAIQAMLAVHVGVAF